jgi:hypothetical protein
VWQSGLGLAMFGEIQTKICKFWRERCREDQLLGVGSRSEMIATIELKPIDLRWKSLWESTKSIQKFVEREEIRINNEIERQQSLDEFSKELSSLFYQIGSIAELKEKFIEALQFYRRSVEIAKKYQKTLPPQFYQHLLASVGRLELQESLKQSKLIRRAVQSKCLPIDRCEYGSLSYSQFLDRYCIPAIPVIITSSGPYVLPSHYSSSPSSTTLSWTIESIMRVLGDHLVTPRHYVKDSYRWAKQEDGPPCKLSKILAASFPNHFPHACDADSCTSAPLPYLVDWSLPQHCPDLFISSSPSLDEDGSPSPSPPSPPPSSSPSPSPSPSLPLFQLPKYFAMDLLQLCPNGSLYKDTWPSLFIGPTNSQSSLHVDTFGSNFWMFLIHGRKKWRFYSPHDLCALSPSFPRSFEPIFLRSSSLVDEEEEEEEEEGVEYYEMELQPGEMIFVPAGSPHAVKNLEGTVAISSNYIDESNIRRCLEVLGRDGLTCSQSQSLKENLERICPVFNDSTRLSDIPFWIERRERGDAITAIPWAEFKGHHHHHSKKRKSEEEDPFSYSEECKGLWIPSEPL